MKLVAYADESGTHAGPGSDALVVGGWIAPREDWARFCADWQHVLVRFAAPYFHFREWSAASAVVRKKREPDSNSQKNPYATWSQSKLDDFLFELAPIAASDNKLIVGGYVPANLLRQEQLSGATKTTDTPHQLCVKHFFDSTAKTISRERAPWKRQPVAFFFDHSTDKEWKKSVKEAFDLSRGKNRQFRELAFAYKEDRRFRQPTWWRIV